MRGEVFEPASGGATAELLFPAGVAQTMPLIIMVLSWRSPPLWGGVITHTNHIEG
jgi:hypothetical protein